MRHTLTHFSVTENLPHCDNCGANLVFANSADLAKDGRLYLIFKCSLLGGGDEGVGAPEAHPRGHPPPGGAAPTAPRRPPPPPRPPPPATSHPAPGRRRR